MCLTDIHQGKVISSNYADLKAFYTINVFLKNQWIISTAHLFDLYKDPIASLEAGQHLGHEFNKGAELSRNAQNHRITLRIRALK